MAPRSTWLLIPAGLALLSVAVMVPQPRLPRPMSANMSPGWQDDLEAAFQMTRRSGRDVLVNFTARRDCHACTLLKKQVLMQPEFWDYVRSRFVLVETDKSILIVVLGPAIFLSYMFLFKTLEQKNVGQKGETTSALAVRRGHIRL
jgi:hypothetical protein